MIKTHQIITLVVLVLILLAVGAFVGMSKSQNGEPIEGPSTTPPIAEGTDQPGQKPPKAGEVTLTGTGLCLPHRDTEGPQTLECALGFQDEQGNNYGLRDVDPSYKNVTKIPQVGKAKVHGVFEPKTDEKYDSIGIITVDSVIVL